MAIVIDEARKLPLPEAGEYKEKPYTKGNDGLNTPNPTWDTMLAFPAAVAETHVNFAYEAPTDNTLDAWVPIVVPTFLPSVPATNHFD